MLAAANPVFGRYDDLRSPLENIEFQQTILSRFDLIFIVKDVRNRERDKHVSYFLPPMSSFALRCVSSPQGDCGPRHRAAHPRRAAHGSHAGPGASELLAFYFIFSSSRIASGPDAAAQLDVQELKRYIAFARQRCAPRLSERAAEALQNHYVNVRSTMRAKEQAGDSAAVPITVRQLEAIVRVTEALSKMVLCPVATDDHVNEAINLFKVRKAVRLSPARARAHNGCLTV